MHEVNIVESLEESAKVNNYKAIDKVWLEIGPFSGDEVVALIENYPWRGNVRELQNEIQRAMIMTKTDSINVNDLSDKLREK
jgi:transcriptional regulator with PAS, ATPase and Fis domain